MNCRHCHSPLILTFADLGCSPPSNSYLTSEQLHGAETYYPLLVKVCEQCWLVQTIDYAAKEEFFSKDYSYFSSFSSTFLDHCRAYVQAISGSLNLDRSSFVIEVASNDGYLLQYIKELGIPCLGIEPTASTARAAREKGVDTLSEFFGESTATDLFEKGIQADLMIANNVLAHVPDINDFLKGFRILLKQNGVATFEFPHLTGLVDKTAFDTIYHEHYSYLSLTAVEKICNSNGLVVFDVEEISTHGGSLRVYAQPAVTGERPRTRRVEEWLDIEHSRGIESVKYYANFQKSIQSLKNNFLEFLLSSQGKRIIGYGAAAKGNTFINYAGLKTDFIEYIVDRNPAKAGKFMPGSRIPICNESEIHKTKPDFIIIFPWNLREEIADQLSYVREWNARFVVFLPDMEIF